MPFKQTEGEKKRPLIFYTLYLRQNLCQNEMKKDGIRRKVNGLFGLEKQQDAT